MENPLFNHIDKIFMDRAIALAWKGVGKTEPNPLVGAVIVKDDEIIAEGFHERSGEAHAEVIALEAAGTQADGATLYVTLEPCVHHGKTPPCVGRVIDSGIRRVVIAGRDPDPRVDGRGIETLKTEGIEVQTGVQTDDALLLNLPYFKRHVSEDPVITLKVALSLDGKLASQAGQRSRITGEETQTIVHRLRARHRTVVIGIDTLLTDRPKLDCRRLEGNSPPVPVVLDARFRFPVDYPWIDEKRRFYVCTRGDGSDRGDGNAEKVQAITRTNGKVLSCDGTADEVDLKNALQSLGEEGMSSFFVEGGGKVFSSFMEKGLWDVLYVFIGPHMFGEAGVPLFRKGGDVLMEAQAVGTARIGNDYMLTYLNRKRLKTLLERLK